MGTRYPVWSVVVVWFLSSEVVCAQDLPAKPVRLLVPSVAGGPSDFAARLIAPKLGVALDRNVIVDARASVNGIVATEIAAHAAPDGSTLAIGNNGTHVINAGLYRKLPYDPVRDFAPVSKLISAGTVLVAHPRLEANSFREFIAAAKREPGKSNIAVAGANGAITTEVLKSATGINLNNVPYKGSAPSEFAVVSGEVCGRDVVAAGCGALREERQNEGAGNLHAEKVSAVARRPDHRRSGRCRI